jgi:quinol monooxygenase YgiN
VIIIAGEIDFDTAANRDQAIELGRPLQQATRDDEPGCVSYCFAPDPCIDTRVQVYELWEDEASLAAHFGHENYFNMRTTLGDCGIVGADTNKYRIDAKEPVYDATFTPRADFTG